MTNLAYESSPLNGFAVEEPSIKALISLNGEGKCMRLEAYLMLGRLEVRGPPDAHLEIDAVAGNLQREIGNSTMTSSRRFDQRFYDRVLLIPELLQTSSLIAACEALERYRTWG